MAAKNGAKDPLTRALEETPVARKKTSQSDVVEQPTPRAQPVGEVLETLQEQAKDAMPGSFFDDGATTKTTPVTKRMRSEVGTVEVSAKRRDPNVQASVAIDVRCDRDEESDAGRYQVRTEGHVARASKEGLVEAKVPVSIEVNDADGGLKLDSDAMREEIANAIRSTGRRARGVSPGSRARRPGVRSARHLRAFARDLLPMSGRWRRSGSGSLPGVAIVERHLQEPAPDGVLGGWSTARSDRGS